MKKVMFLVRLLSVAKKEMGYIIVAVNIYSIDGSCFPVAFTFYENNPSYVNIESNRGK